MRGGQTDARAARAVAGDASERRARLSPDTPRAGHCAADAHPVRRAADNAGESETPAEKPAVRSERPSFRHKLALARGKGRLVLFPLLEARGQAASCPVQRRLCGRPRKPPARGPLGLAQQHPSPSHSRMQDLRAFKSQTLCPFRKCSVNSVPGDWDAPDRFRLLQSALRLVTVHSAFLNTHFVINGLLKNYTYAPMTFGK